MKSFTTLILLLVVSSVRSNDYPADEYETNEHRVDEHETNEQPVEEFETNEYPADAYYETNEYPSEFETIEDFSAFMEEQHLQEHRSMRGSVVFDEDNDPTDCTGTDRIVSRYGANSRLTVSKCGLLERKMCVRRSTISTTVINDARTDARCKNGSCGGCCRDFSYLVCDETGQQHSWVPCICNTKTYVEVVSDLSNSDVSFRVDNASHQSRWWKWFCSSFLNLTKWCMLLSVSLFFCVSLSCAIVAGGPGTHYSHPASCSRSCTSSCKTFWCRSCRNSGKSADS
jgi:hypothetical protein